ncbi:MAG: FG-GAP-like repeat-containing protein [Bacteroidota bacterium]
MRIHHYLHSPWKKIRTFFVGMGLFGCLIFVVASPGEGPLFSWMYDSLSDSSTTPIVEENPNPAHEQQAESPRIEPTVEEFTLIPDWESAEGLLFDSLPPGLTFSEFSFADIDNDDDLDFLLSGLDSVNMPTTAIYIFAAGKFIKDTLRSNALAQLFEGASAWGDYDNDGDMDLALSGNTSTGVFTGVYENDGTSLIPVSSTFLGAKQGDIEWVDLNNDGFLDLSLMGSDLNGPINALYLNQVLIEPSDPFILRDNQLPLGLQNGSFAWSDYDNDGDVDVLIVGEDGSGDAVSELLDNNGKQGFSVSGTTGISDLKGSGCVWGDFDNDGWPDILLSGLDDSNTPLLAVFRNNRNGSFTRFNIGNIGAKQVNWGDYDDDGDLDIWVLGDSVGGNTVSHFYTNVASTYVLEAENSTLIPDVSQAAGGLMDYDSDGKLDFFITGMNEAGDEIFQVYHNIYANPTPKIRIPATPLNVLGEQRGDTLLVSWEPPTSLQYPVNLLNGLSYNLYVGIGPSQNATSANSNLASGSRKIIRTGNAYQNTEWAIINPPTGSYNMGVQSIDADFEGSPFINGSTVQYVRPNWSIQSFEVLGESGVREETIEPVWVDFDRDQDLDLWVVGSNGLSSATRLFENQDGVLSEVSSSFPDFSFANAAWGDFNRDGFPDVIVCGEEGGSPTTKLYQNGGDGSFNEVNFPFEGAQNGDVVWIDYDQDGDLDILYIGMGNSGALTRLYRNEMTPGSSAPSFSLISAPFPGLSTGNISLSDVDKDGNTDVFLIGMSGVLPFSNLYFNRAGGVFEQSGFTFPAATDGNSEWADYDNDGDPDLVITGTVAGSPSTSLWRNDGAIFTEIITNFPDVAGGDIVWGDLNLDGWRDLIISGNSPQGATSNIFFNSAGGVFTEDEPGSGLLPRMRTATNVSLGDLDGDNALDILFSGPSHTRYIRNLHDPAGNTTPSNPINLVSSQVGRSIVLSWDPSTLDDAQISEGYSYNLVIGTSPGAIDFISPLSFVGNGRRLVATEGAYFQANSLTIQGIPSNTYYWSVQAIDQDFEGSTFAPVDSFEFFTPLFLDSTQNYFSTLPIGVKDLSMAWGDYNNDNTLDLIVSGEGISGRSTRLFRNTGTQLVPSNINVFADISAGSLSWGDYDTDGLIDLLLMGQGNSSLLTVVYRNNGNQTFTPIALLEGLSDGDGEWIDLDNDGDLDIVLSGNSASGPSTLVYYYEGQGNFVQTATILPDIAQSKVDFADFDQDGYKDLLVSGQNAAGFSSINLFRSLQGEAFEASGFNFENLVGGDVSFVEVNNDGYPDIAITGESTNGIQTLIYLNTEGNSFTQSFELTGIREGNMAWGDYNNDGFSDLFLTGFNGSTATDQVSQVFRNQGGQGFQLDEGVSTPVVDLASSFGAWGDYDADGKLDIVLAGEDAQGDLLLSLYHNEESSSPTSPPPPSGLTAEQEGPEFVLNWNPPTGSSVGGYTYNFYVEAVSDQSGTVSVAADLVSGKRKIVARGNALQNTSFRLGGLPEGTYTWGVQSIDADFEGSTFEVGASFTFTEPDFQEIGNNLFSALPEITQSTIAWGDYNSDSQLDFVIAGQGSAGLEARLYRNDSGTGYVEVPEFSVGGVRNGYIEWGDYDNDADLDVFVLGENLGGGSSSIYRNDGNNTFTRLPLSLEQVKNGGGAWGDYDNDGDLDIVIFGEKNDGERVTRIYENRKNDNFVAVNIQLPGLRFGTAEWGDMDNDRDLDLLITGERSGGKTTALFENNGGGRFSELFLVVDGFLPLEDVSNGSASWGDYNNDAFLDILLVGEDGGGDPFLGLYLNNSNGNFSDVGLSVDAPVDSGRAEWGDFNDDGFLDILVSGKLGGTPNLTLLRNVGGASFVEDTVNSIALRVGGGAGFPSWADFDQDGKLDVVLSNNQGINSFPGLFFHKNVDTTANLTPGIPTNLQFVQNNEIITLSWDPPVTPGTRENGFTYNLYVGRQLNAVEFQTPMANLNSGRREVVAGGPIKGNSWELKGFSAGEFFWSVQAIDQDFEGSLFAAERSFIFLPPDFKDRTFAQFGDSIPGFTYSDVSWVDVNNDDRLDLFVTGSTSEGRAVKLYANNPSGFELVATSIQAADTGEVAWGDYNNDSLIDLVMTGQSDTGVVTLIYPNQLGGFGAPISLEGLKGGSVDWGDYDNDGFSDLLVTGINRQGVPKTLVYKNLDDLGFEMAFDLIGIGDGAARWADINRDGWIDLALTGRQSNGTVIGRTLLNQEGQGFLDTEDDFGGMTSASLEWGDFNQDGWLDLLLSGEEAGEPRTRILENLKNSQFQSISQLDGVIDGEAKWADFNDDGFPDIALTGNSASGPLNSFFRNLNGNAFEWDSLNSASLVNLGGGSSMAWADFDKDGKIDLAQTGRSTAGGLELFLYRNFESTGNGRPEAPESLVATPLGQELRFSWSPPASFDPSRVDGLTYNLYIGTVPGAINEKSPVAGISNGFRKIIKLGDITDTTWTIQGLPSGPYYWSVQAIDSDFEGSEFAPEQFIQFVLPAFRNISSDASLRDTLVDVSDPSLSWGDFDNDNDLDLLVTGSVVNAGTTILYENLGLNSGNLNFSQSKTPIVRVEAGTTSWADYDQDGFLDFVISGESAQGLTTRIYRNDSTRGFIDIQASIPGLRHSSIDWGDLDNDGDFDLLLCGVNESNQPSTLLYLNQGENVFSSVNLGLPSLRDGVVKWIDFNSDGLKDIFLSGESVSGPRTLLYQNLGNKKIEVLNDPFPNLSFSDADWGDLDNDGFPELVFMGEDDTGEKYLHVYKNEGGTSFTPLDTLIGMRAGDLELNDFDEDGYQDILVVGLVEGEGNNGRVNLYRNRIGASFELDTINSAVFPTLGSNAKVAWGDVDNNGKIDFAIAGSRNGTPGLGLIDIFFNIREGNADILPLAPGVNSLDIEKGLDRVTLSWEAPSSPLKAQGYTFNVFVGTAPGKDDILSAQANISSGKPKIVHPGNMGHATSLELLDLAGGAYYWGVQSIDQEYEASPFQMADSFQFIPARFIEVTNNVLPVDVLGVTDGDVDMGDFDNDNNLDILVSGATDSGFVTKVYRNVGQSRYEDTGIDLPGLTESSVAWGDFNNDGFLDAAIAGFDGLNSRTLLYQNVPDGEGRTLQLVPEEVAKFADLRNGSLDWGDFDNDGYLDLLLVGQTVQILQTTAAFRNLRGQNGKFFDSNARILAAGLANSDAKWGDVDNDGDLDILVTGSTGVIKTQVILNDCVGCSGGNPERFLNSLESLEDSVLQLHMGSVEWGDWDNDADLDILITGEDVFGDVHTRVYTNLGVVEGETRFTDAGFNLPGIADGEARWGDYNQDNFLDIVLSGRSGANPNNRITALYSFDPLQQRYIPDDLANSILKATNENVSLSWADYDRDGLLDLFVSGREAGSDSARVLRVYQNNTGVSIPPAPPIELSVKEAIPASASTFDLVLEWSPPDSLDVTKGYTYNLVFSSSSLNNLIVSPLSDTLSGIRRVVRIGNLNQATEWTIKGIPEGSYKWSVQSVDQSFEGSEFSSSSITLEIPSFEEVTNTVFSEPPVPLSRGDLILGDVDNDEDLDLFVTGISDNGVKEANLYLYSVSLGNKFTLSPFSDLIIGVTEGQAAWGDYDLDGDLDLIVTGEDADGMPSTRIYNNGEEARFEVDTLASADLPQLTNSSVAWGDYNRDGFPDLLISGNTGDEKVAAIYTNDGERRFDLFQQFGGVDQGSVAWGDYNRDSNLDFIITGLSVDGSPVTNVFQNSFNEVTVEYSFQNVGVNIQFRAYDTSVDWEDVNNDGYLDLLLTGTDFLDRTSGALFVFNPESGLYQPSTLPTRVSNGEVSLGDYNFDGFRDLLITGTNEDGEFEAQVAPNTQSLSNQFGQDLRSTSKLIRIGESSSKWGEIGRPDGKLDIFMSGITESGETILRVFENVRTNSPPNPPVVNNLTAEDENVFVTLQWELPPEVDSTIRDGLTYNLILENVDSATLQVNPLSEVSTEPDLAIRRVIELGNVGHFNQYAVSQISTGTYRWGIQVVGANHEGGPFVFADETFTFSAPEPGVPTSTFIPPFFTWDGAPESAWVEIEPRDRGRVREVEVKYKPISQKEETYFSMELPRTGDRYTFDISNTVGLDGIDASGKMIGIEYFFDVIGRFTSKEVRTETFYTYIKFPDASPATNFTARGITAGDQERSYQMITVPLELENPEITSVLEALDTYDDTQWRLFSTIDGEYVEYQQEGSAFTQFEVGKSFWIIFRSAPPSFLNFGPGEGTTVQVTQDNPFVIPLQQGWNQIGNPYNFRISWADVLEHNKETYPDIEQQLDPIGVFVGQPLVGNDVVIREFSGGLLFSHSASLDLEIPIWKDNSIQLRLGGHSELRKEERNPIHFANWGVELEISNQVGEKAYAEFGMNRNADESRDIFDRMRAPRFTGRNTSYFDVTFEHPEYFYPYFSTDYVPTSSGYVWEFTLSASSTTQNVEITWDNSTFGNGPYELILYELDTERTVNMNKVTRMVSNSGKANRNFRVVYGDQAFVDANLRPSKISLGEAYPNPFKEGSLIPFTLSDDTNGQQLTVDLRVYNLLGQEVAPVFSGLMNPGFHELYWSGRDRAGNPVAAGTYLYTLKVYADGHSYHATGKLIKE